MGARKGHRGRDSVRHLNFFLVNKQAFHPVSGPANSRPRSAPALAEPGRVASHPILLITEDLPLHHALRSHANEQGRMVIRVTGGPGTVDVVRVLKPSTILLDLDQDAMGAWTVGEALLSEHNCPPVLLLTVRKEPFDLRTAVRAGSVFDKSLGVLRLLESIDESQALSFEEQAERNDHQSVLLRWLKPGTVRWPRLHLAGTRARQK